MSGLPIDRNIAPLPAQGPVEAAGPSVSPGPSGPSGQAGLQPDLRQSVSAASRSFPSAPAALEGAAVSAAVEAAPDRQGLPPGVAAIRLGAHGPVALLPLEGVSGANDAEKAETVCRHVEKGRLVFNAIMHSQDPIQAHPNRDAHGNPDYNGIVVPGKKDAAALMWYLQALGSAKAKGSSGEGEGPAMFKEGSFMLADTQGRMEAYLAAANSYERSSSHMRDFQAMGNDYRPRGLDVRNAETPHGRRTMLFQRVPATGDENLPAAGAGSPAPMPGRTLFIKMEPHGCRGLSNKGGVGHEHGGFLKGLKRFFSNIGDTICHAFGFLQSVRQRSGAIAITGQNNRERIPKDIETGYKNLIKLAEESNHPGALARLTGGAPLSDSGGIRVMQQNLDAYDSQSNSALDRAVRAFATSLRERYFNIAGDASNSSWLRIGNEIWLPAHDYLSRTDSDDADSSARVAGGQL